MRKLAKAKITKKDMVRDVALMANLPPHGDFTYNPKINKRSLQILKNRRKSWVPTMHRTSVLDAINGNCENINLKNIRIYQEGDI